METPDTNPVPDSIQKADCPTATSYEDLCAYILEKLESRRMLLGEKRTSMAEHEWKELESISEEIRELKECIQFGCPCPPRKTANKTSHPTRGSGAFVFGFHSLISLPQSDAL